MTQISNDSWLEQRAAELCMIAAVDHDKSTLEGSASKVTFCGECCHVLPQSDQQSVQVTSYVEWCSVY